METFVPHTCPKNKTRGLAILRGQSDTQGSHRILARLSGPGSSERELSGVRRRASKHAKGHSASAGADQSGHGNDFSFANFKAHIGVLMALSQSADLKHHFLDWASDSLRETRAILDLPSN